MAIASRVKWYLDVNRMHYETILHAYTETSDQAARVADVPSTKLAKGVLLEDDLGYVMLVIPASRRLDLRKVNAALGRELALADRADTNVLFFDCDDGAVPPMGAAYGIPTIIDDQLLGLPDVYFEGGTHVDLVHMDGADFYSLIPDANHADVSAH